MSAMKENVGNLLTSYEAVAVGTYKDHVEPLLQKGYYKFVDVIDYHDQLSKRILEAAELALEAATENSADRESIKAHLEKCLSTQLAVFINKNKGTIDRKLMNSRQGTEEGVTFFEKKLQKRLRHLPETIEDGSVDEYLETVIQRSREKTLKHLSSKKTIFNAVELNFRIDDRVDDIRDESIQTIVKAVTIRKQVLDAPQSEQNNSKCKEELLQAGTAKISSSIIPDDKMKNRSEEINFQLKKSEINKSKLMQEAQESPEPNEPTKQPDVQEKSSSPCNITENPRAPPTKYLPNDNAKPPSPPQVKPRLQKPAVPMGATPKTDEQIQRTPKTDKEPQRTPLLQHVVAQAQQSQLEDSDEKKKGPKRFLNRVKTMKKELKSKLAPTPHLARDPSRREPHQKEATAAVVPLANLSKVGINSLTPEEDIQTRKISSEELTLQRLIQEQKLCNLWFLITKSRVYVTNTLPATELQRQPSAGIVRSFVPKQAFEYHKIELNGDAKIFSENFSILDLLGSKCYVNIGMYQVSAEEIVGEYFRQISTKVADDKETQVQSVTVVYSAHLSVFQTQRLKTSIQAGNFQRCQLVSLHALVGAYLCQNVGETPFAQACLIIHFTAGSFQAAIARVASSAGAILGYADYTDIKEFNANYQLFISNHKHLCEYTVTNKTPTSKTITDATGFYQEIIEKVIAASRLTPNQIHKIVHVVFETNHSKLKTYLKRVKALEGREIVSIPEEDLFKTTGLPTAPLSDAHQQNLSLLVQTPNNAIVPLRLLDKSKPLPKRERSQEFNLPQLVDRSYDLCISSAEKEKNWFGNYVHPSRLVLTTYPDGTYRIQLKDSFGQIHSA